MAIYSYLSGKYHGIDFSRMGLKLIKSLPSNTQKHIMWRAFYGYSACTMAMLSVKYLPLSVSTPALMGAVFVTLIMASHIAGE